MSSSVRCPPITPDATIEWLKGFLLTERSAALTTRQPKGGGSPRGLLSAARAVRAAPFLCAIHSPGSRRDNCDPWDHVGCPFLCRFFGADASVAGKHFALDLQRDIASTEHDAPREQPDKNHIVYRKNASLWTQES